MHLPCIYRVFGKEYDEDNPEQTLRTGQVSNNSVKCPLCNQRARLRNIIRLYLQDGVDNDAEELDRDEGMDPEIIIMEDGANLEGAHRGKVKAALENSKARISELNSMLTSVRRRYQAEQKEKMRLEQENEDLSAKVTVLEESAKRRLDAMRGERDHALRERKMYEKKAANLQVEVDKVKQELEGERAYSSRQAVALDDGLVGARLQRKLRDCGDTKDWFHETLEARNRKVVSLMNSIERMEKEAVALNHRIETLERENQCLTIDQRIDDARGCGDEKRGGQAAVLTQIQNVPALSRKSLGCANERGGVNNSRKINVSLTSSKPCFESDVGQLAHCEGGSGDKRKATEDSLVVLLEDEDDVEELGLGAVSSAVSSRWKPAAASFALAGPSKDTVNTAPGPSFIKRSAISRASTGLDNPGKFIKRYPDGRGGWCQSYTGRGNSSLSGSAGDGTRKALKDGEITSFFQKR